MIDLFRVRYFLFFGKFYNYKILTINHCKLFKRITIAHRIELADKEVEYMQKQCAEFERGSMKKKVELATQSEEMKQRMNESIEAAEKFESEVLKGVDPARKKVPVEKFTR